MNLEKRIMIISPENYNNGKREEFLLAAPFQAYSHQVYNSGEIVGQFQNTVLVISY